MHALVCRYYRILWTNRWNRQFNLLCSFDDHIDNKRPFVSSNPLCHEGLRQSVISQSPTRIFIKYISFKTLLFDRLNFTFVHVLANMRVVLIHVKQQEIVAHLFDVSDLLPSTLMQDFCEL